MTFEEIFNLDIKLGQTITLESGWGYFINQSFYRLYEDTDAVFVSSNGSGDIYVTLPKSSYPARIPRRAIKAVK